MDFNDCSSLRDVSLKQELLQMTSVYPEEEPLYHYTSQKGLSGILQKEKIEFRFSRIDCLNDFTEGKGILEYYRKLCKQLLQSNEIDEDYFKSIINTLPMEKACFIYDEDSLGSAENQTFKTGYVGDFVSYMFSLSSLPDSLPMWNYYLKNTYYNGYNLGFSTLRLKEQFHYHPFKTEYLSQFNVVEYDDFEKDDILKDYIQALYKYRCMDDEQLSETKQLISRELEKWRYCFKDNAFSHEKEIRLIIKVPLNEDKTELASFVKSKLRYDEKDKIPQYIYVSLLDKKALSEITIAPSNSENKLKELLTILEDKGYNVNVKYSNIPVRF